jgi:HAE1 family hydrophobic/amphiphilic exporter-1
LLFLPCGAVRFLDALEVRYRQLLGWTLGHKETAFGAAPALFLGTLALVPLMGAEFTAAEGRGELRILLEAQAGTSLC